MNITDITNGAKVITKVNLLGFPKGTPATIKFTADGKEPLLGKIRDTIMVTFKSGAGLYYDLADLEAA
jgi:hypothetical protein